MARALRTIGTIAAGAAIIATAGAALGPALGLKAATATTLSKIGTISAITAGVANVGAQLTQPKPIARGSPARVIIEPEPPRPYIVGEVMTGGVMRYDNAYGPTIARVPNPYRWQVRVLSGVGPIQGVLGEFFNFHPISSFYTGFYATKQNLGDRPQAAALVPEYPGAPAWDASSKLSGCAHVGLNFLFDRDAERFADGVPIYTALCQGEKVYDPRQDSTYPGGSGPCRLGQENTYVYSRNPACHAATYAYGRFQDGKRIFGLGLSADAIDWPAVVDWANDCDTNEWTANLILFEGGTGANLQDQRVRNLDDLCTAGGARWFQAGGQLSFDWHRPRVSLATLRDEDILEAGGGTDAVQTVRDRMNGVRPQYIEPDNNWQQVTAKEIIGSTYRAEDGTALTQVWPLNGVTNKEQAGELASYAMADSRELGPMDVQASVEWRFYRPGDCIEIDSSLIAYQGQAVINQRALDPASLSVSLSMKSETPGKHDFALGKVADPPPTPVLAQTAEERDLQRAAALRPREIDAEFGANRTQDNIAAGIAGQAPAATDPTIETGATRGAPAGTNIAGIEATVFASELATARADATASLADLTAIAADGVLSRSEKISVRERRDNIIAEFPIWRDRAAAFGISTALRNSYQTAYDELLAYLTAVNVNSNTDTSIVRADFVAAFVNYADARERIIDALTDEASKRATVAGAEAGLRNSNVQLGANAAVNSDFARGGFGWTFQQNTGLTPAGVNQVDVATKSGIRDVWGARFLGTLGAGSNRDVFYTAAIWRQNAPLQNALRFALPVAAGERIFARARIARVRCQSQLYILFFDKDGTIISAPNVTGGRVTNAADNGDPANFDVIGLTEIAPANAAWAILMVRMVGTDENNPRVFVIEPMIGKIPVNQTALPEYQVGAADRLADNTVEQPVVGLLNPTTGRSTSRRISSQIIASGVLETFSANPLTASTSGSVSTITVNAHTVFDDAGSIAFSASSIGGLNPSTMYFVYESNPNFEGGARTYVATTNRNSLTVFGRRYVGNVTTPASGDPPASGGGGGGGFVPGGPNEDLP